MSSRRWIYVGLGLAAGYGLVRLVFASRLKPGETRLLVIGDSLAVGLSPYLKDMAAGERIGFSSLAIVGTRIDQWSDNAALRERLSSFRPTVVLISLGTNDEYMQGDVVPRQQAALGRLVTLLMTAAPEHIIWIGPPTLPKAKSNGIVAMLKSAIPSRDYFPSEALSIPRGPDGIHPTARGYAGWAGAIWQWLS